jgi:CheY-like chemotaxis protein
MTDLLLGTSLDATQRDYAETIRGSGEALLAIINDILDFSKIEAGKLVLEQIPFSVTQVASECVALLINSAQAKGLAFNTRITEVSAEVLGDPGRVRQVLLNLISNAVKFTHSGQVEVRTQAHYLGPLDIRLELEVSDTGIGMSADYLARLGEAFSQADTSTKRQFGGTGLGLSICRKLIQLMGGSLTVESTPGRGSCFTVLLPFQLAAPVAAPKSPALPAAPDQRLGRVLVAEDNLVNQRVILALLKKFADHIDLAIDGNEAFEKFTQQDYDCILMDGHMPHLDGLGATHLIRCYELTHGKQRTPIIAVTASAMATDREQFLAGGMDEYVTKPVRAAELFAAIARAAAATKGG